jgi:ATP-dependent Lon protease
MKESAQAAWSLLRARAGSLGIPLDAFTQSDVHLHVPAGGVPKDGPSAGITIAAALASLLCRRPARHEVAMTGELTLRGRVLPIGGLKEKLTAAARAGVTSVLVPARNKNDLIDLPEEVRKLLDIKLVETIDDVLELALLEGPPAEERQGDRRSGGFRVTSPTPPSASPAPPPPPGEARR